jgi:membrane-bound lytic murein transglycosylase MltF
MSVLNGRLSSIAQLVGYLRLALLIGIIPILNPHAVSADKNQNEFGHLSLAEKWHGDFDGMEERRLIRVLVVYNKFNFFLDQGRYRGASAELLQAFEKFINRGNKDPALPIDVIFLPVSDAELIPALLEGIGDIGVGNLTITPERLKKVDFSTPFLTDVKEIVITSSKAPTLYSLEDLSNRKLHLRKSSSYYQHTLELNKRFKKQGMKPIKIIEVDEHFEDSDLLAMVNEGLIAITAVDDHLANFWADTLKELKIYKDITLNESGEMGWAFRKNSPKLAKVVNSFIETTKKGTKVGNLIFNKYLHDNKWVRNGLSPEVVERYQSTVALFKKYADQYNFDYLMTKAVAYQESQLDHRKRSPCGAVGIMQLMPKTAADKNVDIPNIENLEDNVHAGHKYLRFIQDRYFNQSEIDNLNKHLLTFAAYNAGPKRILDLRKLARTRGLDPNVWFNNVEVIAAEKIGRETVQYVSNIYEYYISYKLLKEKADKVREKSLTLAEIPSNLSASSKLQEIK